MVDWNPNSTGLKGLEWFPAQSGVVSLDAAGKMAASSFVQTASQATGGVRVPISALPTRGGLYVVEAYDNETGVTDAVASLEAVPNEDVSTVGTTTGLWREQDGSTTTTIFSQIDEGSAAVNLADSIRNYASSANSGGQIPYIGRFNTGSLSLTGKRIVSVQLNIYANLNGYAWAGFSIGGVDYVVHASAFYYNYTGLLGTYYYAPVPRLYYNPATKLPWTIADIQAFDTTDEWWVSPTGSSKQIRVYAAWLTIETVTENRLAVGKLDDTASALTTGWNTVALTTPIGGAWTKDGAGSHLYTVRRLTSTGAITIPYLEGIEALPSANGWEPTVDPTSGRITAMGTATKRLVPFVQRTTVPADSIDSLPYYALVDSEVYTGRNGEQEFSNAAATAYGVLRFLAKNLGATADLLVKVKRRSDNVQLGGTATLTAAAFSALPTIVNGIKEIHLNLASPGTLAAATQYYIEFSSAAAVGAPWAVVGLDTLDAGNIGTFGGTTDRGTVDGTEADRYDVPVTLETVPVAPANFAAVAQTQAISGQTVCGVTTIPRSHLSWTATGLGAQFAYYEIQRSEDAGATWTTVSYGRVEATATFDDYEGKLGVSASYRIRAVKTNGAASDWSSTATVAKSAPTCASVYFVSNYDPTYNVAYETAPDKDYTFTEADDLVTVAAYGRDALMAFVPLESRGSTVRYTVTVGADDLVPIGGAKGLGAFDPLRNIAHAPLPYVCVLDHYGQRLFAALSVPGGTNEEPTSLYVADLSATQVSLEPYAG